MNILTELFGHIPSWESALGGIVLAIVLASALAELLLTLVRKATGIDVPRPMRFGAWLLLTTVLTPPILELFGEPLRSGIRLRSLAEWVFANGLRVLLIGLLAYIVLRVLQLAMNRFEYYLTTSSSLKSPEDAKRAKTIANLVHNVARTVVVSIAALMIMQELRINIMPILTGAGILGLAVGFGAQTLVKDVISGFFLILEDQIRVGDLARIGSTAGMVEAINLRTIVLRDMEGAVHIFPCGSVGTMANLSKDFAYAVMDVEVAYRHDPDEVIAILESVGAELKASESHGSQILEPLEVFGLQAFGESAITIRVRFKTGPLKQFGIRREFNRRMKLAFRDANIEIPFPQRDITIRQLPAIETASAVQAATDRQ